MPDDKTPGRDDGHTQASGLGSPGGGILCWIPWKSVWGPRSGASGRFVAATGQPRGRLTEQVEGSGPGGEAGPDEGRQDPRRGGPCAKPHGRGLAAAAKRKGFPAIDPGSSGDIPVVPGPGRTPAGPGGGDLSWVRR